MEVLSFDNYNSVAQVDGVSLPEGADSWKLHELEERLQQALVDIGESVEIVPVLDIRRMEWLARWADVLKEAERQGYGVLDAVRAIADKEIMECDLEIDQLRSFVHSMESLAEDMEYFDSLVNLCPQKI
uniref:Uncharacterized protein n=1 Tax=Oryza nivara TaxID=4536 RepID=A0A0E0GVP8_ORYNI